MRLRTKQINKATHDFLLVLLRCRGHMPVPPETSFGSATPRNRHVLSLPLPRHRLNYRPAIYDGVDSATTCVLLFLSTPSSRCRRVPCRTREKTTTTRRRPCTPPSSSSSTTLTPTKGFQVRHRRRKRACPIILTGNIPSSPATTLSLPRHAVLSAGDWSLPPS